MARLQGSKFYIMIIIVNVLDILGINPSHHTLSSQLREKRFSQKLKKTFTSSVSIQILKQSVRPHLT